MRRVLVTGGAGFIGAHLIRALVRRGDAVRVLDNLIAGSAENLSRALDVPVSQVSSVLARADGALVPLTESCEVLVGDLLAPRAVARACENVDVVFHQAALRSVPRSIEDPTGTHRVNVTGTLNLLEAARAAGVRRVVFASSSSIYGDNEVPTHEGLSPRPKSPYAASKLAGEIYCATYTRTFGLSTIALRYFNVFGPWQDPTSDYAAVIPKFIRLAKTGASLPVHGDGLQSRDFTYIDNVVAANLAAAESTAEGVAVNIGAGQQHSLMDLIDLIERHLGRPVTRVHEPARAGDVRHTQADISLARRLIRYDPAIDFETGLRMTIEAMDDSAVRDPREPQHTPPSTVR
ncbi:MAG TPA: NAD-dependent epimerase/dehydratase family protein [bacterium]|nr:NAD-dependent epimerase/dehydratase family protein [bacterium]